MANETVRVACPVVEGNPHGFYVINESDFDAAIHTPFVETQAQIDAQAEAEAALAKENKAKREKEAAELLALQTGNAAPVAVAAVVASGWGAPPSA